MRNHKTEIPGNYCRGSTAMAQLDPMRRYSESSKTPRTPTSPTFGQLIHGDASSWPSHGSPKLGRNHDHEDHSPNKKSVLAKVKEKAKKLRHTLSGKKKHDQELHDSNTTPSWGVCLEDDEDDEDPEYLGAPMYESEMAPETYKETARQHPRAIPVVSETLGLTSSTKHEDEQDKQEKIPSPSKTITESVTETLAPAYAAVSETVSENLAPAYAVVADATQAIASKIAGLTVSAPEPAKTGSPVSLTVAAPKAADHTKENVPSGLGNLNGHPETKDHSANSPQTWDKGVSVKEYVMHKLEPGEDERVLSQVISEAISPRKAPGDVGMVEKVKEAVSLFLHPEETSCLTSKASNSSSLILASANAKSSSNIPVSATNANSSPQILAAGSQSLPQIPISTNAHEVEEEENHGRILQAN